MSDIQKQVEHIVNTIENPEQNWCNHCQCEVDHMTAETPDDYDSQNPTFLCPDCDNETGEMSGFDYLSDALDIEYIVSGDRKYLGARVLVCFGGPNVWINTRTNRVDGHWWGGEFSQSYTDNIGLDESLQELWECGA
jgi:hypothetical protein